MRRKVHPKKPEEVMVDHIDVTLDHYLTDYGTYAYTGTGRLELLLSNKKRLFVEINNKTPIVDSMRNAGVSKICMDQVTGKFHWLKYIFLNIKGKQ